MKQNEAKLYAPFPLITARISSIDHELAQSGLSEGFKKLPTQTEKNAKYSRTL